MESRNVELSLCVWPSPAPRIHPVDLSYRPVHSAPPVTPFDPLPSATLSYDDHRSLWAAFSAVFEAFRLNNGLALDRFLSVYRAAAVIERLDMFSPAFPGAESALAKAHALLALLQAFHRWNVPGRWLSAYTLE
jgi:hypothetical protein